VLVPLNPKGTFSRLAEIPLLNMKRLLAVLALAFVVIQFFRPEKNIQAGPPTADDLIIKLAPPAEISALLKNACYDCHSNSTRYPWYAEIQPTAWWLAQHVRDGKRFLNLSEFGKLTPRKQKSALDAIVEEVESGHMPLKSYTWAHKDARLSKAQIDALVRWCEEASEDL
jgi:hypothetical protein